MGAHTSLLIDSGLGGLSGKQDAVQARGYCGLALACGAAPLPLDPGPLRCSTPRLTPPPCAPQVHLLHLRSWSGMGQALVACASGCNCSEVVLDGHWERPHTITDLATLQAST